MKSEAEIRERILCWRETRKGILVGESTKKPVKHLIEELLWVIGDKHETNSEDNYYALLEMDGRIIEIDCKLSDAFALAVGVETSISVIKDILKEADIASDEISKINTSRKEPRTKILVIDDEERYLNLVTMLTIYSLPDNINNILEVGIWLLSG